MGSFLQSYVKDPDSTELYRVNFAPLMAENAYREIDVTGHEIVLDAGLTLVHSWIDGSTVSAYIGGGAAGTTRVATLRIKIKNPSGSGADVSLDRSIQLKIRQL